MEYQQIQQNSHQQLIPIPPAGVVQRRIKLQPPLLQIENSGADVVPRSGTPDYCPVCNLRFDGNDQLRQEHLQVCNIEQRQYDQQEQLHFQDNDQFLDSDDPDQATQYGEDTIEPSFDIASDEVREARGMIFAAPQVPWANKYIQGKTSRTPTFNTLERTQPVLPSGLPLVYEYNEQEASYLFGTLTLEQITENEIEMTEDVARPERPRPSTRRKEQQPVRSKKITQAQTKTIDTIRVTTQQGTVERQTCIVKDTVSAVQPSITKTEKLAEYIRQLSFKGKVRMGDLTNKDLEDIRNDKGLPSTFRHSIIQSKQSGMQNPLQTIIDFNSFIQNKKHSRKERPPSSSSSNSTL